MKLLTSTIGLFSMAFSCWAQIPENQPGLVKSEFVYETAPFRSAHASTILATPEGAMAAWFGGPFERHPEVTIYTAHYDGKTWSAPVQVADGIQSADKRFPCWNPVLFQPEKGPLLLFYKVGPSPEAWWGMLITSADKGKTWSKPVRLPDGQVGPVRNKPIAWKGGILCGSSSEDKGWSIHMEFTPDLGKTWEKTPPLHDVKTFGLIQPTILQYPNGTVQILNRSRGTRQIVELWMEGNDWKKWSEPKPILLPNNNSGIDAVMLKDGRALLVYNHTPAGRHQLNVATSRDGKNWEAALVLENTPLSEFSYPAVVQGNDGLVHITYTWKRQRIKHAVVDPAKLKTRKIVDASWPQ